jgi:pimeloyl-ACP methyl ester carboxylesterase
MNYAFESYKLTNRMASMFASNWAAKKASLKFLSPNRLPIKAWEQEAEQAGTRFNLTEQVSVIRWSNQAAPGDIKAEDIKAEDIKAEDKRILLVHGWESRATQMYGLVKGLVKQGYTIFAVDMPGHGHSSGNTSDAYLFSQTVKLAQQELGHFHAIIGHSMGAGAASIAVGQGVTSDKLVLISGPSSIENVLRHFAGFVGLNTKTSDKFVGFIERHVGKPTAELDASTLLQSCEIPTLLIHDEYDIEVPISESQRLAPVFNQSELFVTKGLGHRKILKSGVVLAKINDFVNK